MSALSTSASRGQCTGRCRPSPTAGGALTRAAVPLAVPPAPAAEFARRKLVLEGCCSEYNCSRLLLGGLCTRAAAALSVRAEDPQRLQESACAVRQVKAPSRHGCCTAHVLLGLQSSASASSSSGSGRCGCTADSLAVACRSSAHTCCCSVQSAGHPTIAAHT